MGLFSRLLILAWFPLVAQVVWAGEVARSAKSVGLTPKTLAASGFSASEAAIALERLRDATEAQAAVVAHRATVDQAVDAVRTAQVELDAAPDEASLQTALHQAEATLQNAKTSLQQAESALRLAALADRPPEVVQRVERVTQSPLHLPEVYRVAMLAPEVWQDLATALTEEARSLRLNEPLSASSATLLTSVRSELQVIQAIQASELNLSAIQ